MAFQLRRLISTNCFHRDFNNCTMIAPTMLQFKAVPNSSCSCFSYSPNNFIKSSRKEMQFRTSNCLQAVCSNRCTASFFLNKRWKNNHLSFFKQDFLFNSVMAGGNGYTTNFTAHELLSKSSLSSIKNKFKPSAKVNGVGKDAIDGVKESVPQILIVKKRRNKPMFVFDENTGKLDTEVISYPVTTSAETIPSEKKVVKDGENKKGSTKNRGKVQDSTVLMRKKKNCNSKKKEENSESCSSSASAEIKELKKASRAKKTKVASALQIAQNKNTNTLTEGIKTRNQQLRPLYPPSGKSVVVVQSVTKAKVIQDYLGEKYEVLASYGHVRDLARSSVFASRMSVSRENIPSNHDAWPGCFPPF